MGGVKRGVKCANLSVVGVVTLRLADPAYPTNLHSPGCGGEDGLQVRELDHFLIRHEEARPYAPRLSKVSGEVASRSVGSIGR